MAGDSILAYKIKGNGKDFLHMESTLLPLWDNTITVHNDSSGRLTLEWYAVSLLLQVPCTKVLFMLQLVWNYVPKPCSWGWISESFLEFQSASIKYFIISNVVKIIKLCFFSAEF